MVDSPLAALPPRLLPLRDLISVGLCERATTAVVVSVQLQLLEAISWTDKENGYLNKTLWHRL